MTIKKDDFVRMLKFIKKQHKKEDDFVKVLEKLSPHTHCDCYLYCEYEDRLIHLLEIMLDDKDEDIYYFLTELDFLNKDEEEIKKDNTFLPKDEVTNEVLYDSPETLYDYLVSKMK